jgi:D-glycero-D-manno-heptose 1,7-bisphosphate phosphatase
VGIFALKRPRPAFFLDRDGVITENVFYEDTNQWEGPRSMRDFRLLPGVIPALQALQDAGYALILVSNQPNAALGKSLMSQLGEMHHALRRQMRRNGIRFLDYCYCLHHPQSLIPELGGLCRCRKPSPYWLHYAAARYGVDLRASWMAGDRETDSLCAARAGVRAIRVGQGMVHDGLATMFAPNLPAAVEQVLRPWEIGREEWVTGAALHV